MGEIHLVLQEADNAEYRFSDHTSSAQTCTGFHNTIE